MVGSVRRFQNLSKLGARMILGPPFDRLRVNGITILFVISKVSSREETLNSIVLRDMAIKKVRKEKNGTGSVFVRFDHPSKDLTFLSDLLGFQCFRSWTAGELRKTPNEKPLPGINERSYWVSSLEFRDNSSLYEQINLAIERLMIAEKAIHELLSSGGRVALYLTFPGSVNIGTSIDRNNLKKMVNLGVELDLEVFPGS
jgi:hypothetical protein